MAEHAEGARAGPVFALRALVEDPLQELVVLLHGVAFLDSGETWASSVGRSRRIE